MTLRMMYLVPSEHIQKSSHPHTTQEYTPKYKGKPRSQKQR